MNIVWPSTWTRLARNHLQFKESTYRKRNYLVGKSVQTDRNGLNPWFRAPNPQELLSGHISRLKSKHGNGRLLVYAYQSTLRDKSDKKSTKSVLRKITCGFTCGFIVVDVDSFQLKVWIAVVRAGRINSVLVRNHFPKLQIKSRLR